MMGLRNYLRGTIFLSHAVKHFRTIRLRRTHPYGVIPDTPSRVIVEPTNACNLRCSYCGNKDMARPWKNLKLPVFRRLVGEMVELGIPRITLHTVGEPTLHPEFPRMVRIAKDAGLTVTFSTNATTLTEDLARELVHAGPDILNVSVDVADPEKMKKLREGVDPERVVEGMRLLKRLRDAEGPEHESPWGVVRLPSLVATCVVTRYWDRDEERAWFELYGPLIDDAYFHWPNAHAGYVADEPHKPRGLLPAALRDRLYKKVRYSCPYPWDALFLLSDGTMSVCRFDFDARVEVGRYPEQSIPELWHGQKMMSLRKAHMDFDFRDWSTCENCNATYYENRHEHYRLSQRLKRRNGFSASRDMWLSSRPMEKRRRTGTGAQHG
jgi:MoaA/NifB/PqqE/SkfB family radical SAM enzyme